jgi:hypothetical protein
MRNMNPAIGLGLAALWLAACARDDVSLGDDSVAEPLTPSASCAAEPFVDGDVHVTSQAELDALAGCEEISGSLEIEIFPGTDLRPLASLRAVGGELVIGDNPSTLDADSYDALLEAGWLESFAGVEALERVGALTLVSFAASDLSPFSGLRHINVPAAQTRTRPGVLNIAYARNLVNLRGLEGVGGVESMTLAELPALESLDGVILRNRFDNIMIANAPRLSDIGALAPLERGNSLAIVQTAVEDLSSLAALVNIVDSFTIQDNPLLADASSIPTPDAGGFVLTGNTRLRGTLDIRLALSSSAFFISGNPELERIAFDSGEVHLVPWECGGFSITSNQKLRAITSPNGCDRLDSVDVQSNPSLETLDLGRLRRLDELHIRDNPGLFALSHAEFERIYVVDVVNNPLLSTGSLASVPAFERTLEGNAD